MVECQASLEMRLAIQRACEDQHIASYTVMGGACNYSLAIYVEALGHRQKMPFGLHTQQKLSPERHTKL